MRVRFVHIMAEIDISKPMLAPRRVSEIDAWLKQAKKTIPEIPSTVAPSAWRVSKYTATPERVVFHLSNENDGKDHCQVVIDRRASRFGINQGSK